MNIEKRLAILAAAALALGLTGCSSGPTQGIVKDMDSSPGYYISQQVCSSKPTICTPIMTYIPPSWSLDVWEQPSDESRPHGWVDVGQSDWARCHVGDLYSDGRCKRS